MIERSMTADLGACGCRGCRKEQEAQKRLFHLPLAGLLTAWLRDEVSTGGYAGTPVMLDRMYAAAAHRQHVGMDADPDDAVAEKSREQKREDRARPRLRGENVAEDGVVSESDRLGRCSAVVIEGALLQMVLEGDASHRSLATQYPLLQTAAMADAIAAAGGGAASEEEPGEQAEQEEEEKAGEEEEERSRGLTRARRVALEAEAERRSAAEEVPAEAAVAPEVAEAEEGSDSDYG